MIREIFETEEFPELNPELTEPVTFRAMYYENSTMDYVITMEPDELIWTCSRDQKSVQHSLNRLYNWIVTDQQNEGIFDDEQEAIDILCANIHFPMEYEGEENVFEPMIDLQRFVDRLSKYRVYKQELRRSKQPWIYFNTDNKGNEK